MRFKLGNKNKTESHLKADGHYTESWKIIREDEKQQQNRQNIYTSYKSLQSHTSTL